MMKMIVSLSPSLLSTPLLCYLCIRCKKREAEEGCRGGIIKKKVNKVGILASACRFLLEFRRRDGGDNGRNEEGAYGMAAVVVAAAAVSDGRCGMR